MILILLSLSYVYMIYYKHSCMHHLHCTWLGCIRSYTEDLSDEFFASWWVVHSYFMDLGNPFEVVIHYLLIGGMICLSHQHEFVVCYLIIGGMTYLSHRDRVPKVSILMCMVTHWTKSMPSHDIYYWVVMILPSYYTAWALNLEKILS